MVALRASRKRLAVENLASRKGGRTFKTERVYDFEAIVEGEQTFESGEFRFEVDVPLEIDTKVNAGGLLGDALRAAQTVKSMAEGQLRWRLVAFLDIPWKRNVTNEIELAIRDIDLSDDDDPSLDVELEDLKRKAAAQERKAKRPPAEPKNGEAAEEEHATEEEHAAGERRAAAPDKQTAAPDKRATAPRQAPKPAPPAGGGAAASSVCGACFRQLARGVGARVG